MNTRSHTFGMRPGALILAAAVALAQPAAAQRPDVPPISSAAMLFTCCTPELFERRMLAEAEASGAEYVRVDIEVHGAFARREPDWERLDALLELARHYDVKLLGILRGTPGWLTTCPDQGDQAYLCAPSDPAQWGRLAGEIAAHAGAGIDHWEILNEPDARWAFRGRANDYARMLSAAYDEIKARAPGDQVVFGGVERPREHAWIEQVLATPGADAIHKFDIAAVHLRLRLRNVLADLPEQLLAWRALLGRHGFDGPVWVTEHGYPADPAYQWDPAYRGTDAAGGAAAQARLLRASIPLLADAGASQIFITLRDNLFGEFLSEGIEHIDESQPSYPATRRESFAVLRDLALKWNPVVYARSGAREQDREALDYQRLAQASAAAGKAMAAALQSGAAEGHELVALELVKRAR
jgi:hypothetical protein